MAVSYTVRAVVVGVDEYVNARHQNITKLQCARNDALEIARMLQTSTTLRFAANNPHLLTNEQANKRAVRRAVDDCFSPRDLERRSIALFYFAGHGIVKNERVYLCCHNVDFYYPEEGGIRLNDIYDWLKECSAECAIAIIDACFSGGLTTDNRNYVSAAEHARRAIEDMKASDGKTIAILAACRRDQQARENPGQKHGIFTQQILWGLRDGLAGDAEGTVTLLGLINYLDKSFARESQQKPKFSLALSDSIILGQGVPLQQSKSALPTTGTMSGVASPLFSESKSVSGTSVPQTLVPGSKPRPQSSKREALPHKVSDFDISGPSQEKFTFGVPEPILDSQTSNVSLVKSILIVLGLLLFGILIYFTIWH